MKVIKSAKLITVIETISSKGMGTEKDPVRTVIQYWDFKGKLLAENDSFKEKEIGWN